VPQAGLLSVVGMWHSDATSGPDHRHSAILQDVKN